MTDQAAAARCPEGCFWVSHHAANAPIWLKICGTCRAIDGEDLRTQLDEKVSAGHADALRWAANRIDPGPRSERKAANAHHAVTLAAERGIATRLRLWADNAERGVIPVGVSAEPLAAETKPSPYDLWVEAKGDRGKYRDLLRHHGHLIPNWDAPAGPLSCEGRKPR